MGMDVSGIAPSSEAGEYFRANCWSWRPIHALIWIANARHANTIVSEEAMKAMHYNDGAGLQDQASCDNLAAALEEILEDPVNSLAPYPDIIYANPREVEAFFTFPLDEDGSGVDETGRFVSAKEVPVETLRNPYSTHISHVREFISFLRDSGGFSVW